jgi:hypothetical protein
LRGAISVFGVMRKAIDAKHLAVELHHDPRHPVFLRLFRQECARTHRSWANRRRMAFYAVAASNWPFLSLIRRDIFPHL